MREEYVELTESDRKIINTALADWWYWKYYNNKERFTKEASDAKTVSDKLFRKRPASSVSLEAVRKEFGCTRLRAERTCDQMRNDKPSFACAHCQAYWKLEAMV